MRTGIRGTGIACLALAIAACGPLYVEMDPPMAAERESDAPARTVAAEIDVERALPITAEDIGDLMVATGMVVGSKCGF